MRVFFLISISDPRFPFFLLPFSSSKKKKRGKIERKGEGENRKIKRKEAKANETMHYGQS